MAYQYAHDFDSKPRTADVQLKNDQDFPSMFLPDNILRGLKDCGFKKPSPIQLKAVPLARCGFDLIIHAKSGTGKTLVFTLIVLEFIKLSIKRVQSVIITPTREIALQIADVLKAIGKYLKGFRVGVFIGGTPLNDDLKNIIGCQVAVGCPGRLKHLVELGSLDLKSTRILVLDEADQLMDDVFINDLGFIASQFGQCRQLLACTATISSRLESFIRVEAPGAGIATPEAPGPLPGLLLGLRHFVTFLPHHPNLLARIIDKQRRLLWILSTIPFDQAIVFSNYFSRAETISSVLEKEGWAVTWLAGRQEQAVRMVAVEKLKGNEVRVLVATDLAARGIDAHSVNLVINMDVPSDARTYLHRAGRAGRYGSQGLVISIVSHGGEEEAFRRTLGRVGGAEMRVGVLEIENGKVGTKIDPWNVEERELEMVHGIPPPEEDSGDSGRDSEVEGGEEGDGGGGSSEAEADRYRRRKRKKEGKTLLSEEHQPKLKGTKKVKLQKEKLALNTLSSPMGNFYWDCISGKGMGDLVSDFSKMSTSEILQGSTISSNKRKLSSSGGGGSSNDLSDTSSTSSGSEGEYILPEATHSSYQLLEHNSYPPLDRNLFKNWYSLWKHQTHDLKCYVNYYKYLKRNN